MSVTLCGCLRNDPWCNCAISRRRQAIEQEAQMEAECRRLAGELVRAAWYHWHRWDGRGGYIYAMVREAAQAAGYEVEPPPREPSRKAKIPARLRTAVYERDGYACVVCGIRKELTLDHIIPEALGGPTTFENLQTMCRPHNIAKGVRV